jgi:hypothetical protein
MAYKQPQAGFYTLKQFKIRPIFSDTTKSAVDRNLPAGTELNKVIVNWGISESMDSPYVHGFAVVHESNNILKDLPIIGEEQVYIQYIDYYGKSRSDEFYVYSVEEVQPENSINDRMLKYIIRFCSKQKLHSDRTRIRRSYADQTISEMAQALYDEYFRIGNSGDKAIEIEATTGTQTLVIPNLRPDEAMNFLARRAFSSENKSSSFRFFETREKYFFCTYEYLVDKYKDMVADDNTAIRNNLKFIYNTANDNSGPGQDVAQQSISSLTFGTKVNSIADIKNGNYRRRVTELDYLSRTRITRDYDYSAEFDEFKKVDNIKQTHTGKYIDTFMQPADAPETVLIADYPQIGQNLGEVQNQLRPYQYYYENYTIKPIVDYHMSVNAISTSIKGRVDMYPGKVVILELYEFAESLEGRRKLDTERTGKYIVTAVNNSFNGDEYSQQITLTKGGLRGTGKEVVSGQRYVTYNMEQGLV